jgi:hypothetical protein
MIATARAPGLAQPEGLRRICLFRTDPLFHLLKDRWRLRPWQCGLLFAAAAAPIVPLSALDGNLFPRPGLDIPLVDDWVGLLVHFAVIPLGAAIAMRFYNQAETVFERLYAERVVRADLQEYNRFLTDLEQRYNSRGRAALTFLVALLIYAWVIYRYETDGHNAWNDLHAGVVAWYNIAFDLIVWWSALRICAKAFTTARAMQSIFRWPIHLHPLHSDGCGGLRRLTDISVTFALFLSLLALCMAGFLQVAGIPVLSLAGLLGSSFILLTPFVFFACLAGAHRVMAEAKEETSEQINRMVEAPYLELRRGMASGELREAAAEEVLRLEAVHDFVRRLPSWPADTRILTQMGLSVLLPTALILLQLIGEQFIVSHQASPRVEVVVPGSAPSGVPPGAPDQKRKVPGLR